MKQAAAKLFSVISLALPLLPACQAPAKSGTGSTAVEASHAAAKTPLIPRDILFGNPDRAGVQLSPDGKQLSFLAPVNGVLNVWVAPLNNPNAAKAVTNDNKRGIRNYFWAHTNDRVIYLQDTGGDENWHAYAVDLSTLESIDLTPLPKVNARIQEVSPKFPHEILIAINDRNPQWHEIYRVNVTTGERTLLQENEQFVGFSTDDEYRVRFASKMGPDGGMITFTPKGEGPNFREWSQYETIPMEDSMTSRDVDFDKTGKMMYTVDSRGRNTGALYLQDLATREKKLLAEDARADAGGVLIHPTEKTVQAVSFNFDRNRWRVLDKSIAGDLAALAKVDDGEINIGSRSLDDKHWIVVSLRDDGPARYYHWDRAQQKANFLFTNLAALEKQPLVKMEPVVIKSRDGLDLVSYLSLPREASTGQGIKTKTPIPMILNVHGGPWARDNWGYNPIHQMFANRGYAVLSVNFRGSTGMGKALINASNHEWGGKMHDDLIDAVNWAVEKGIADPKKVAIMGGSYGGYATLAGLTMTPDVFACGVDIVGPSNIATLLKTIPPYWKPMMDLWKTRVGDVTTPEGQAFLDSRSPLTYVDKIKKPLLIGQGANDPRVKQSESDQIVKAMQAKNIPVSYVLFPDEGHGFARPENRLAFYAITEAFLAKHLGGRFEPVGNAFAGSSVTIPVGEEFIPGLKPAVAN